MNKDKDFLFLVDTNVLINTARATTMGDTRNKIVRCKTFFQQYSQQIGVLDLIWNEFLGVYLHKNINFNDYDIWLRNRQSFVEQMFRGIIHGKSKYICINNKKAFKHLFTLAQDFSFTIHTKGFAKVIHAAIDESFEEAMTKAQDQIDESRLQYLQEARINHWNNGKIFDGMDGALALYVHLVTKTFSQYKTILVTEDRYLKTGMNVCHNEEFVFDNNEKFLGVACNVYDVFKLYGKKKVGKKKIEKVKRSIKRDNGIEVKIEGEKVDVKVKEDKENKEDKEKEHFED